MSEDVLVKEVIEAGTEFISDFNNDFPVSVACWVIPVDSDHAWLYIASDRLDDSNLYEAYGQVPRVIKQQQNSWLDPFQVKLIHSSHPLAVDARAIRDGRAAQIPVRYHGTSLGGIETDFAYIYPVNSTITTASP